MTFDFRAVQEFSSSRFLFLLEQIPNGDIGNCRLLQRLVNALADHEISAIDDLTDLGSCFVHCLTPTDQVLNELLRWHLTHLECHIESHRLFLLYLGSL